MKPWEFAFLRDQYSVPFYLYYTSTTCLIFSTVYLLLCPPYEVLTRPRPQTLHRSHDNLINPYRIATIFYMQIDIGERITGKQDGPGLIIYGPPRAPRIAKNAIFLYSGPYMKNGWLFFSPCYTYICSVRRAYCPEIFVHLGATQVPPGPPTIFQNIINSFTNICPPSWRSHWGGGAQKCQASVRPSQSLLAR